MCVSAFSLYIYHVCLCIIFYIYEKKIDYSSKTNLKKLIKLNNNARYIKNYEYFKNYGIIK